MCVEEKRFSLVLPKGKAPQGGWKILATSLRSIRVVPVSRPLEESKEPIRCWEEKRDDNLSKFASFAEVLNRDKRELGNDVWIESESGEV